MSMNETLYTNGTITYFDKKKPNTPPKIEMGRAGSAGIFPRKKSSEQRVITIPIITQKKQKIHENVEYAAALPTRRL
jgi:hypothetical protein